MVREDQKKRLLKLTSKAVNAIMCDFNGLISLLLSSGVITDGMYYDITSHSHEMARARTLHMKIMNRGTGAYEKYYQALHEVGQYDLAEQMEDLLDPRYGAPLPRPPMVVSSATPAQTSGSVHHTSKKPDVLDARPPPDYDPTDLEMRKCNINDKRTKQYNKNIDKTLGHYNFAEKMEDPLDQRYRTPSPTPAMGAQSATPVQSPVPHASEHHDLPNVWPPPGYDPDNLKMRNCDINDEVTIKHIRQIDHGVYNLPHGKAIIINNKNFNGSKDPEGNLLEDRHGTDKDSKHMDSTLKALNFDVDVAHNCNADSILTKVKSAAKDPRSEVCFICVILSHGSLGIVYGVDGQFVRLTDITGTVEQLLPNGPKVFIIQACQGAEKNSATKQDNMDTYSEEEKKIMQSHDSAEQELVELEMEPQDSAEFSRNLRHRAEELRRIFMDDYSDSSDSAGKHADIFVAVATVPRYVSWRNLEGSWFIQALVYVLNNLACSKNIDGIFTKVQNLVSRRESNPGGYKQVPIKYSTLSKELFFFPGITQTDVDGIHRQKRKF